MNSQASRVRVSVLEKCSLLEPNSDREKIIKELRDFKASDGWCRNFKKRYKISRRKINTKTKITVTEIKPLVQDFFGQIQQLRIENPDIIFLNLDETAIFFEMSGSHTLDVSSAKRTMIRTTGNDKQRITVIPIIASDGYLFPPIIIYKTTSKYYQNHENYIKGLLHNIIVNKLNQCSALVFGNSKAWNNTTAMVKKIIPFMSRIIHERYGEKAKDVMLLMDNFSGHINDKVINKLNKESKFS